MEKEMTGADRRKLLLSMIRNADAPVSGAELGKRTGASAARIPVAKVTPEGEIVEVYPSARVAARENHMSYQTVLDRCNGKVKKPFALDGHTYQFER